MPAHPAFAGIGAIAFDAYGTLYDIDAAARRCRDALGDKADAFSALWRQKQLQYMWLRSLQGHYAPFSTVTAEALDFAMDTFGFADAALRAKLIDLYREIDAFPDVPAALAALKAGGRRLAILSNGSPDFLAPAARSSGLDKILEASLSVEAVKIFKPDPRVYKLAVDHFGLPPERIGFVSSNAWDACAGAAYGFKTAWLNRAKAKPERLPGRPAAEITRIDELAGLLGAQ